MHTAVSGESNDLIGADAFSYAVSPDGEEVFHAQGPLTQLVNVKVINTIIIRSILY